MKRILSTILLAASPLLGFCQEDIHLNIGDARLDFFGYGQATYTATDADGDKSNGFDVTRVILMTNVHMFKKLDFFLMLDAATKTSDKLMHEYWGNYQFCKEFGVKFGQGKIPFSIENPMSPTAVGNFYFHDGIAFLAGMNDAASGSVAGRDFGLSFTGKALKAKDGHDYLGYAVGLFNGSGMNHAENNNQKDFVACLDFYPIKDLKISTSTYLGVSKAQIDDTYGQFVTGQNYKRQRWAMGFEAKTAPLYLRSEYLRGWDEGTPSQDVYAEAWLHLFKKNRIDLVLDYEYFDKNIHLNAATRNYLGGLQWWFHKQCRLSALFQHKDPTNGGCTNRFVTQLQLRF